MKLIADKQLLDFEIIYPIYIDILISQIIQIQHNLERPVKVIPPRFAFEFSRRTLFAILELRRIQFVDFGFSEKFPSFD
jgi:hypothetical protein